MMCGLSLYMLETIWSPHDDIIKNDELVKKVQNFDALYAKVHILYLVAFDWLNMESRLAKFFLFKCLSAPRRRWTLLMDILIIYILLCEAKWTFWFSGQYSQSILRVVALLFWQFLIWKDQGSCLHCQSALSWSTNYDFLVWLMKSNVLYMSQSMVNWISVRESYQPHHD